MSDTGPLPLKQPYQTGPVYSFEFPREVQLGHAKGVRHGAGLDDHAGPELVREGGPVDWADIFHSFEGIYKGPLAMNSKNPFNVLRIIPQILYQRLSHHPIGGYPIGGHPIGG